MKLKRLKEAKKGYLDDEGKFFDFQTSEVSNGQYIDATKTGVPYYDGFLNPTDAKELEQYYNLKGEVVMMSPSEYFSECSQHIFESHPSVESLKRQRGEYDRNIINHLKEVILKYKRRFPMPYLNYTGSKGQEGLHRMLCLAELTSWDTKFPVLVITYADQDRADRENKQKEISKLRIKINSAIQDALRYRYSDIEEFKEQLQFSLDREWEWMNLPSPSFTLTEEGDSYIVTIGEASEEFLKSSLKIEKLSDEEYELDLDDVDLDNNEDFLIRYFGNDWRETYPHLKDVFKIDEELTTKTVRRDNPNDFSPFGYKVDFYDGDYHIGEGSVCGIKDGNAFLYDFEVYPKYRGMGYSKEMLQYLIDKYDLKQLFVKPDNNVAINLYQKYGFEFNDAYDPDDIGNMRLMIRESMEGNLRSIVSSIYDAYMKYDRGEGLNQNCMLCTWAVELQLRGYDFLPRPVYSPTDIIFTDINGYDIIKNPKKVPLSNYDDLVSELDQVRTGRFYCHVNWTGSTGGHEFLLIKENGVIEIVDAQDNKIETLTPNSDYFSDVNWKNSFIVRLDNKPINKDILKYNDMKYAIPYEYTETLTESYEDELEEIQKTLDKFDYAFIDKDGNELDDEDAMEASVQSPEQFSKLGKGVCTDYVEYTKKFLDDRGIDYTTYDISFTDEDGDEPSHVCVVAHVDDKYVWIENSWYSEKGNHEYSNLNDFFEDIAKKHCVWDGNDYLDSCVIREFDKSLVGMTQQQVYDYMHTIKPIWTANNTIRESFDADTIKQMDKAIVNEFGRDYPGEGCILIAPDGTFINVYPTLADHEDLCIWLTEQGFDGVVNEAEWLVETFNYVRCRNNPESLCYIELPLHNITRHQLYSLEDWINEKVKYDHISIELPDGVWKRFSLNDYFAEDVIKKIKRYYASGTLYEDRRIINDNK